MEVVISAEFVQNSQHTSDIDPPECRSSGFSTENFLWLRHPGSPQTGNQGHPRCADDSP